MKKFTMRHILVALILVTQIFGVISCSKDFEELNENPNNAEPSYGPLFANVLVGTTGHRYEMARGNLLTTMVLGMHAYSTSPNWGTALALNDNTLQFAGEYWARTYVRLIGGIDATKKAIEASTVSDGEKARLHAVADIWRVMLMHRLTDMFGDVPYFEAGMALDGNFAPKYDKQKDIYTDMFKKLDAASNVLKGATALSYYGESDMVYKGDYQKWYKLANSLRLRLALRVSSVDATQAESEAKAALAGLLIESVSETCEVMHTYEGAETGTDPAQWSPDANGTNAYVAIGWHTAHASSALINKMKFYSNTTDGQIHPEHDPRLTAYFVPVDGSTPAQYLGGVLGTDQYSTVVASTSDLNGNDLFSLGHEGLMLGADEVAFLKAEAALKGWLAGDAKALYTKGVELSLEYHNVYASATTEFWSQLGAEYDNATDKLEPVVTQRWIALMSNGFEAWSLIRRTNYPTFKDGVDIGAGKETANRVVYPNSEYNTNRANLDEAAASMGGDKSDSKLWWDVK